MKLTNEEITSEEILINYLITPGTKTQETEAKRRTVKLFL